jgi:hypothetical protein|tara:strand:- start:1138 stop:1608 length:471 start_codon:yes stop_codon:yes gene_type:complete
MRYLRDELVNDITGLPFEIEDPEKGVEKHEGTLGELLGLVMQVYDVNHSYFVSKDKLLSPSETADFNRLVKVAEEGPKQGGWFHLETGDLTTLTKVVEWAMPISPFWRHYPQVKSVLAKAPEELPDGLSPDQADALLIQRAAAENGAWKTRVPSKA